ncbi:hypothetical protein KC343_g5558 [Hortaea werneckii]|nr:hypothetical protein KC338_g3769 [Hortaea werneckii]KAI6875132.1 hypothetical protein KC323_g382 [Hortaea werneckii]KAI7252680.1 hypothetical protein KC352_g12290 [Hortaea werneckii]KAI7356700.1 hypothetical protein KC320_g2146 [Hortaea werneckii]KAI7566320.1 hypothetical protein KC317_g5749 [Hortaea werneckii]
MPLATPDDSISDETSTRAGLEPSILPPPESLQGPHGDAQNTAVVGSLPDAIVESSPIGSSTGPEVTNDTPGPAPSRQLRERKPRVPSVSSKRASDPGDPFEQMSGKVQRKRLGAVKTLEQAWSEKQDEWLPRPLWAAELCVNGDPDQLKPPRDWDTRVLVKLSKVAELTPRDLASAQSYLQEAGRHHGFSWDDEPTAAGITMHKLREVLKSAHRLAACAPSSGSLPVAQGLGGEGTARPPRAIGSSTCKGPECSDVDDEEPPMLLRQGIKRELSEGSQESIVVTGTGPNKRLRTDPQPRPQPEPQPRAQPGAQLEPPANASDRFRLELEEATEAAELAAARFDMLEKNRRVQRLRLQLSS